MASKDDLRLAYEAGRACALTEPRSRSSFDACPFDPGTDEADEWARGFTEADEETNQ